MSILLAMQRIYQLSILMHVIPSKSTIQLLGLYLLITYMKLFVLVFPYN